MTTKKSEIKFFVELDENKVPEKLSWTAQDGGIDAEDSKALMLSIWDRSIDQLWT